MRALKITMVSVFFLLIVLPFFPINQLFAQPIIHAEASFTDELAKLMTNPMVIPILLTLGSLGLVVELFSPRFGIPGMISLASYFLFFYGHIATGIAGFETLVWFAIGVALLLFEIFLPGGIVGVLGIVAIIASFLMASDNMFHMGISILISLIVASLAAFLMVKVYGKQISLFKKMILTDSTATEKGYVSNENRPEIIGRTGITMTPLRPAGVIELDQERMDVVSEGRFIGKGVEVLIIKSEGARVVVREIEEEDQ